jgi:hypothetical protein
MVAVNLLHRKRAPSLFSTPIGTRPPTDYSRLNAAIYPNIKPIIVHVHPGLDRIYFVPGGWIHIRTCDRKAAK